MKLDPHHARKHPHAYDAETLHAMLIDDYVAHRPLGGPAERGAGFLIGACQKIAYARGVTPEVYFQALLTEGAALTGSTAVAMA